MIIFLQVCLKSKDFAFAILVCFVWGLVVMAGEVRTFLFLNEILNGFEFNSNFLVFSSQLLVFLILDIEISNNLLASSLLSILLTILSKIILLSLGLVPNLLILSALISYFI